MTSPSERLVIFKLYSELRKRRTDAEKRMKETPRPGGFSGGIGPSDLEIMNHEKDYSYAVGSFTATTATLDSVWSFYVSLYTKWDIELAIQENENRIGELKYEH